MDYIFVLENLLHRRPLEKRFAGSHYAASIIFNAIYRSSLKPEMNITCDTIS